MSRKIDKNSISQKYIDYDVHGLVGIRLINPSPRDAAAVAKQLGPLQAPLSQEPDIIIRFTDRFPTPPMQYLGLNTFGFTDDAFYALRSNKGRAHAKISFDKIGQQCEILCESGARAVPLLIHILNLTLLKKDCISLHASAFNYKGTDILVCGWSKGGKTESLLAFAAHGAKYIGDEWVVLSGDGQKMYGVPENIRLWEWHLEYLPHVRRQLKFETHVLFKSIHFLDGIQKMIPDHKLGSFFPVRYLRRALPAFKRQLNVQVSPQKIFGSAFGPFVGKPEKVFLMMSHEESTYFVEQADPVEIARRMVSSVQYEQRTFREYYLAFKFAFPELKNPFLENAQEKQLDILSRALAGKAAYTVRHPYPPFFPKLYETMRPFCEGNSENQQSKGTPE